MGKLRDDPSLKNRLRVFPDRRAAGRYLAGMLPDFAGKPVKLFAIPAGGVPVAVEIAKTLQLPLELIIVRKIQLPWTTEAGFGALDPEGTPIFNEPLMRRLNLTPAEIETQMARTLAGLREREARLRGGRPYPELSGDTVIVVDDGLASGYTMRAAVGFLRRRGAKEVVVAVPTASERTVLSFLPLVDLLVCPNVRGGWSFAVADAFEHWYDLDEAEVLALLKELQPGAAPGPS